jgi:hypothetical protein
VGLVGWAGFGPNTQTGRAKLFLEQNAPAEFVATEKQSEIECGRTNGYAINSVESQILISLENNYLRVIRK